MSYIPMYLTYGDRYLRESVWDHAELVLYDVVHGLCINGWFHYSVEGGSQYVLCKYMKKLNVTVMYVPNNTRLDEMLKPVLLRYSRMQFGIKLFPYGPISREQILNYALYATHTTYTKPWRVYKSRETKEWYDAKREIPNPKVSALHLRHITRNEMQAVEWEVIEKKCGWVLQLCDVLIRKGATETFIVGILVWALSLPDTHRQWAEVCGAWHWYVEDPLRYCKRIKQDLTLRLKALQNLVNLDLTPFFEWEVLINRGLGEIDWDQEKENRTKPNTANIPEGVIYDEATKLFTSLKSMHSKPSIYTWDKFWQTRWQWAPPGAYHSQYEEDNIFRHREPTLRHKFYALNAMPKVPYTKFAKRKPQMCARASIKYEWGKTRAIYGVDVTNFVMSSFAMAGCEEMLSAIFPIGKAAESKSVKRSVEQVLRNGVPFCFDFEDFNSQHSVSSMQAVLKAYYDAYFDMLTPEQRHATCWVIESLEDIQIQQPDGRKYTAHGTLLSGWRMTTFINTILNYIYTQVCMDGTELVSTHNGDDVLAAVRHISQVQKLERNARKYNIRYQNSKCYLAAIGEFLRVDHKSSDGSQYLARSISTYVHGPTESVIPNDPIAIVNAIVTREKEILQRGGEPNVVRTLTEQQLIFVGKRWDTDYSVFKNMLKTHKLLGGLSDLIEEDSLKYRFHRTRIKEETRSNRDHAQVFRILPGVWDYTNQLIVKYGLKKYWKRIAYSANKAIFDKSLSYKFKVESEDNIPDEVTKLNCYQYGMLRSKLAGAKVNLAKSYGIPLHAINCDDDYVTDLVTSCADPLRAISIWC